MIAANELRIGNWVMYDNRLFQIEAISRSLPCLNTDEFGIGVVDWNNINPIPLTPEILEKCGFVRNNTACYFGLGNYYIHYQIKTSVVGIAIINDDDRLDADEELSVDLNIKHLHQLQNIYWCLTSTELNYTP